MNPEQAKENQQCRTDVLEYLAARPRIAQSAETITRKLSRENPEYSQADVSDALEFLVGLSYVRRGTDALGGISYYQIAPQGTLYIERKFGL